MAIQGISRGFRSAEDLRGIPGVFKLKKKRFGRFQRRSRCFKWVPRAYQAFSVEYQELQGGCSVGLQGPAKGFQGRSRGFQGDSLVFQGVSKVYLRGFRDVPEGLKRYQGHHMDF